MRAPWDEARVMGKANDTSSLATIEDCDTLSGSELDALTAGKVWLRASRSNPYANNRVTFLAVSAKGSTYHTDLVTGHPRCET
jgi:hypothetical protein